MDALRLPVMNEAYPISDAISHMHRLSRSGILVEDEGDRLWAVKAAAMIVARNEGKTFLREVTKRAFVQQLSTDQATNYELDLVRPWRTSARFERLLDAEKSDYLCIAVITDTVPDTTGQLSSGVFATIITRHEEVREEMSSPGDCHCTGPRQHSFPPPPAVAGTPCPMGDGATVVCL